MRLCSNPSICPAFERLLEFTQGLPLSQPVNEALDWESSVSKRKQRQHHLKPDEVSDLVWAYKAGELVEDLADRFSIHRTTVIEHVRRSGLKLRSC